MQECVNRAALVSDERVTLKLKNKEMEISGQSILGDACESMPIVYERRRFYGIIQPQISFRSIEGYSKRPNKSRGRDDMSHGVFKIVPEQKNNQAYCA